MSMSYKGYTATIEYVPEDNLFWGEVAGISDCIIFSGSNVDELKKQFPCLQACPRPSRCP